MYWDRSVRQVQAHKIFLLIQSQCRSTNCRAASRECHKQNFPKLHNYMKSWKNSNSLALLISFLLYREGISFLKFDISSVQGIIYIMSAPEAGRKVCVFSSQFCHGFSANSFYNSFLQFIHQITTKKNKKKSSSGPLLITFWWTTEALKVGITLLLAVIICAVSKRIIRTAFQFPSLKVALDGRDEPKSPLQSTTAMNQVQYCVLQSQHRETAEHEQHSATQMGDCVAEHCRDPSPLFPHTKNHQTATGLH